MNNDPLNLCKYGCIDLAERFIQMSEKFLTVVKEQSPILRFAAAKATEYETRTSCGTVACHGGFGLIILPEDKDDLASLSFVDGAHRIAQFLGFESMSCFIRWAGNYPEYWGNRRGIDMFTTAGAEAFGADRNSYRQVSLLTVAQWYANVAARLLRVTPSEVIYG